MAMSMSESLPKTFPLSIFIAVSSSAYFAFSDSEPRVEGSMESMIARAESESHSDNSSTRESLSAMSDREQATDDMSNKKMCVAM